MTLFALLVNYWAYWGAVTCLYTFNDPAQLQGFLKLTELYFWTTSAILLGYLGINGLMTWNHTSTSLMSSLVEHKKEVSESLTRIEHVYVDDDPSAPKRPYSTKATE